MSKLQDAINALNNAINDAKEAANWLWGLLQGDFNEDQTPAQVITNAGISIGVSMTGVGIIVAWILDLRDFCACVYLIYKDGSKSGGFKAGDVSFIKWFLLVIMLVGLVPALGDLLKGVLRIIYLQFVRITKTAGNLSLIQQFSRAIDASIPYINQLLQHETVRKYLTKMGWQRPFREMAVALKNNYRTITNLNELSKVYGKMIENFQKVFDKVKRFLPNGAQQKFDVLLSQLKAVQTGLNSQVAKLTKPLQECIDTLIIKLEKQDLATYAAASGRMSTHFYGRIGAGTKAYNEAKKMPFLIKYNKFPALEVDNGVGVTQLAKLKSANKGSTLDLYNPEGQVTTFSGTITKSTIKGPTKLYRVIDPIGDPNGQFWVTEEVFKQLKTRNEWRDKLAVRVDWNANGQYVTMDIPKGQTLEVWRGKAGSQPFDNDGKSELWYQGGTEQIVFNARNTKLKISERIETNWGYLDNDQQLLSGRVVIFVDGSSPKK